MFVYNERQPEIRTQLCQALHVISTINALNFMLRLIIFSHKASGSSLRFRRTMAGLTDLPSELLIRIVSLINDQSDLWRLSRTSKAFSLLCEPFFQRSFSNLDEDPFDPRSPSWKKIHQSIRATPAISKNITTVEVRSLRMSSYSWLFTLLRAIQKFSYIHTFDHHLSIEHHLTMDHLIGGLLNRHSSTLQALTEHPVFVHFPQHAK